MEGFIAGKCSVNIQYARRVHLTADLGYKIVVRVSQKNGNSQGIQGIHTVHTLIKPPRPRLGSRAPLTAGRQDTLQSFIILCVQTSIACNNFFGIGHKLRVLIIA